ncbi:MAG: type II secretion system F family protein [Candidatus Omnitrophica bacterium]|nr:type II secretion system F family protein [Candidatus Omnitrophota bacterium]
MPNYKYLVRTREGKPEEGVLEANNEDELIGILQARGLTVVTYKEAKENETQGTPKRKKAKMHSGTKLDDLIGFARQLTTLLGAGITLLRGLEIVTMQVQSKPLHDALQAIKKDVSSGSSLKAAIAKHPKIFSKLWVNIVDTGEMTGQLPFALEQLSGFLESSAALQSKVKSATVYPLIILCVAGGAVGVFVIKIIPMFHKMYSSFGAPLPGFTELVFGICLAVKKYILLFVVGAVGIVLGFRFYLKTPEGKRQFDILCLKTPLVGDMIRELSAVRFASGLSMLIKSGTPILHAMDIVIETSSNSIVRGMLEEVKESVRGGKSMAEPLLAGGIFPDMLAHMVGVGEESGELASMLDNAAKFYGERVDATVSRLMIMFEPLLIVFIGGIVGTLVVAMFLPIFGLSTAMKSG